VRASSWPSTRGTSGSASCASRATGARPLGRGIYNRNLFVGFRNALGGVTAIALIVWGREALAGLGFPTDFAYLLLADFALTAWGSSSSP
jgi:hypothetical protein